MDEKKLPSFEHHFIFLSPFCPLFPFQFRKFDYGETFEGSRVRTRVSLKKSKVRSVMGQEGVSERGQSVEHFLIKSIHRILAFFRKYYIQKENWKLPDKTTSFVLRVFLNLFTFLGGCVFAGSVGR